jgi:hypothetical protein
MISPFTTTIMTMWCGKDDGETHTDKVSDVTVLAPMMRAVTSIGIDPAVQTHGLMMFTTGPLGV